MVTATPASGALAPPRLRGVLETALYVDDLDRAGEFYEGVLLLFQRGSTLETVRLPGGVIPPHDGHGPLHMAFAIAADELASWERRLEEAGVAVEGRTDWPRGGQSVYFRDSDGHLLELATPGLWSIY